jgi:WXG100 family type VII secretion target
MTNIRIPHEVVRAAGGVFVTTAAASLGVFTGLASGIASLVWEGVTSDTFRNMFEEAQAAAKKYHEELDAIGQELNAIADRFKAADDQKF